LSFGAFAQTIPNAGFETWSGGNPTNWLTSNIPTVAIPITQSASAHGGSSAAQGTVVSFATFAIAPSIFAGTDGQGFPINSRPAALHGWYKFSPVADDIFIVTVGFKKNGVVMGAGAFQATAAQTTYREFVANVVYSTGETPDTAIIGILIGNSSAVHVGSTFTVDDLAYGPIVNGVKEIAGNVPFSFTLEQNFPNPFNPTTKIQFQIPETHFVTLKVYNLLGQEIATLVNEQLLSGRYRAEFDASNLSSGTYVYRLHAGQFIDAKRLMVVK
jgi:hypothetical protein